MKFKILAVHCLMVAFFFLGTSTAAAATLLYIPIDDRPVCLDYSVATAKAADFTVLTPPAELLAGRNRLGRADELWKWLEDHWQQADYAVLASDSLIYGGLVDSRIHHLDYATLAERAIRLEQLKEQKPDVKLYVFSTIMRTPKMSSGGVEPDYYETYGSDIFNLTALADKEMTVGLTAGESRHIQELAKSIPSHFIDDWLDRRATNMMVNEDLVNLVRNEAIDYLIIGRDDSASFSQSHREWRLLKEKTLDLSPSRFQSFPGADQLGMILIARAYNDWKNQIPFIKTVYTSGIGEKTIPGYEDQPIATTLRAHVIAAGGIVLPMIKNPDLVLAVNTPVDGVTLEAGSSSNGTILTEEKKSFVTLLQEQQAVGMKIALADVAFANGSDNSLLHGLEQKQLLASLQSYAGWNTASNTIGYAVAQGMMAGAMADGKRQNLLAVRYLDEWAYQANIRGPLVKLASHHGEEAAQYLNEFAAPLSKKLLHEERNFAAKHLPWIKPEKIEASFPWNRLFEIQVSIEP